MTYREVLHNHGRRISLMTDEVYSMTQRLRAIERRVSMLEEALSFFLNNQTWVSTGGERNCHANGP